MRDTPSIRSGHLLLALLMTALWGGSFIFIRQGLLWFPPFLFAALRFLLCAVPFIFFIPRPCSVWSMLGAGLGFSVQFGCLFLGMKLGAPAGLSSLLLQGQVLWTALLSTTFLRERLRLPQWVGILLSAVGMLLIAVQQRHEGSHWIGVVLVLIGSLGWACANLFMKRSGANNAFHLMVWVSMIPPIPLLILSAIYEREMWLFLPARIEPQAILALVYVAYAVTLVGYSLWGLLLRHYPAAVVAPFSMMTPLFGMAFAWMFVHEHFSTGTLLAALLILFGISMVLVRKSWLVSLFSSEDAK